MDGAILAKGFETSILNSEVLWNFFGGNFGIFHYCPKLMDGHVYILGAPIPWMGCFEDYPATCWVSSQNRNVG
jgi:hypothetical protein